MGFLKYCKDALGDVLDGFLGGLIDWATDFFGKFVEALQKIVDAFFSIFENVPKMLSGFDKLLKAVLWFVPPGVFNVIYFAIAFIFIICLFRWLKKLI